MRLTAVTTSWSLSRKHHFHVDKRIFNSRLLCRTWKMKSYDFALTLAAVCVFTSLQSASWVFTIEYSPLIIHPSLLHHSILSSLYLSLQSLSSASQHQIVGECKPLFVAKLSVAQAKFVWGGPLSEAWGLIIYPFICLVNSWIKADEAAHERDRPQPRVGRLAAPHHHHLCLEIKAAFLRNVCFIFLFDITTTLSQIVSKDAEVHFQQTAGHMLVHNSTVVLQLVPKLTIFVPVIVLKN